MSKGAARAIRTAAAVLAQAAVVLAHPLDPAAGSFMVVRAGVALDNLN
jgi:hypothetical protein